jgi:hypothetical protein
VADGAGRGQSPGPFAFGLFKESSTDVFGRRHRAQKAGKSMPAGLAMIAGIVGDSGEKPRLA